MVVTKKDQNLCLCPFNDDTHQAFFGVFDGHVDKNCAIEAKEIFPKVRIYYLQKKKFVT
jgi:serine/threonine protein phosphatase PrpC